MTDSPDAAQVLPIALRRGVVYGLGTLLLLVNAWFGTYAYVVVQALLWTQTSLQRGPLVLLFVLALANLGLGRLARRWALTPHELAVLYAMLCAGTCAAGYGFVQILINHIPAPFYADYATGSSRFRELYQPQVPDWLVPKDPVVLNGFFRGNATLYTPENLAAWAVPVLCWSAFLLAIFWTLLCALSLFRRAWVEEERLTFPLVLLPLELAQGGPSGFWTNRWMWIGFVLAGVLESMNFVNFLYPSWPALPIKARAGANEISLLLTTHPWDKAGLLTLSFYPAMIGIAYLLALDVSFSCWFFYLLSKASLVLSAALGLASGGGGPANRAPFLREQSVGAFVGIALASAWIARRSLAQAWREMRRPTGADAGELMSSRLALMGGAGGLLAMVAFLSAAGLRPGIAALFVGVYVCFSVTLARIVSEAGAGWAWGPPWSASQFTADAVGVNQLSSREIVTLLGGTQWTSDMRDNPMPHDAEAAKIGQGVGLTPRALLKPLLFASALGILAAFWAHLDIYYTYGAATAKVRPALQSGATGPARQAVSMLITPTFQDVPGLLASGVGLVLSVGLSIVRMRVSHWPLHPLGYALGLTSSMEYMWCPFLIAWGAKWATIRYGGIAAYRRALPFVLGLILGDYVVPTLWGLFGMATGYQQYMVFPH